MNINRFDPNELIINYHDAVIYGRDLQLFDHRTEWLNDSCIHFYFTYLQQQQRTHHLSERSCSILFMDPAAVSFWIHQCSDQEDINDFVSNY